jgi:hypothetical protein
MIRVVHVMVIAALLLACGYVYRIKFEAALQAERVARLRLEIRREQEAIAEARATWQDLNNPARIQELADRHLPLKPANSRQFDDLAKLPERPIAVVRPAGDDPIAVIIQQIDSYQGVTGGIPAAESQR